MAPQLKTKNPKLKTFSPFCDFPNTHHTIRNTKNRRTKTQKTVLFKHLFAKKRAFHAHFCKFLPFFATFCTFFRLI